MTQPDPSDAPHKQLAAVFGQHMIAEFRARDADQALETMTDQPHVLFAPTLAGGTGRAEVRAFYADKFLSQLPPDIQLATLSRTLGTTTLVDEAILSFTHTIQMDWILPGVAPTGRKVEVALVVVVGFKDAKVDFEHLYWDQACVLQQIGLDRGHAASPGAEVAHRLRALAAR